MEHNKKIGKSGSITIPANLRRDLGIEGGERFRLEVQPGGEILLKRTAGSCIFCKSDEELKAYKGKFICAECVAEIGTW